MAGTREGARKAALTMKRKYGTTSDGKSLLHVLAGSKGGANSPGGLFENRALARLAGSKGGRVRAKQRKAEAQYKRMRAQAFRATNGAGFEVYDPQQR